MVMHFQRFEADNPEKLLAQIERAQSDLAAAVTRHDHEEQLSIAASLGSMLTTARRGEEARQLLLEYLARARQRGTPEQIGWLLLFLATANQYLDQRPEASRQFDEALAQAKSGETKQLEHFVLHHWGRFLVEDGEFERAKECFKRALALRVELNDPKQASSRRALEAIDTLARETDA
jgi:tetratricopeptide (TPR) repeat protein